MSAPRRHPRSKQIEWIRYRDARLAEGAGVWTIAREISILDEVLAITVYDYIRPDSPQVHYDDPELRALRKIPIEIHNLTYQRQYRRLTRHPKRYLDSIFLPRGPPPESLTTAEITQKIRRRCERVAFGEGMIERLLRRYEEGQRQGQFPGPPHLREIEEGVWCYQEAFSSRSP